MVLVAKIDDLTKFNFRVPRTIYDVVVNNYVARLFLLHWVHHTLCYF